MTKKQKFLALNIQVACGCQESIEGASVIIVGMNKERVIQGAFNY